MMSCQNLALISKCNYGANECDIDEKNNDQMKLVINLEMSH